MKIEEANKIIAEYMGREIESNKLVGGRMGSIINPSAHYLDDIYSESLDALVPVWEKLHDRNTSLSINRHGSDNWFIIYTGKHRDNCWTQAKTLQESACVATAKAIQELTRKERVE